MPSLEHIDDVFRALFSAWLGSEIAVSTPADRKRSVPDRTSGAVLDVFDHGFLVGPTDALATWPRCFVTYTDLFTGHALVTDGPLEPRVRETVHRLRGPESALFLVRSTPFLTAGDRR